MSIYLSLYIYTECVCVCACARVCACVCAATRPSQRGGAYRFTGATIREDPPEGALSVPHTGPIHHNTRMPMCVRVRVRACVRVCARVYKERYYISIHIYIYIHLYTYKVGSSPAAI